jgi:hypothetical protein
MAEHRQLEPINIVKSKFRAVASILRNKKGQDHLMSSVPLATNASLYTMTDYWKVTEDGERSRNKQRSEEICKDNRIGHYCSPSLSLAKK